MSAHHPTLARLSSIKADGSRDHVHPADVNGRFTRARRLVFWVLIGIYAAVPWIEIGGNPAVRIDIPGRTFYLLGATFNAQDFWLFFFFLFGAALSLVVLSAVAGRVWCGWACPQTVYLEAVYRPIERLIEGPRTERLKRNAAPMRFDKLWRKGLKHALYLLFSLIVAHVFLSYFTSLPALFEMVRHSPSEHPVAFAWMLGVTALMYGNFWWFREQLCLAVCPYGRLQSALADDHSLIIGYDAQRGEPRGKAKQEGKGDCVDCNRCVVVCPTGIDIRNGLQLDCIGCAACVDACDEIMDKLHRPRGLVRYDSHAGLTGQQRRILRPRLFFYGAVMVVWAVAFALAASGRTPFEANLLRQRGLPYSLVGETLRNQYSVHVVNKRDEPLHVALRPDAPAGLSLLIPQQEITLPPLGESTLPLFAEMPRAAFDKPFDITLRVEADSGDARTLKLRVRGPQ